MSNLFKAFLILTIFSIHVSCKKDYNCSCETNKTTEAIYYLNKEETPKSSVKDYEYFSISEKKSIAGKTCDQKESKTEEENSNLPEGRTGGKIITETNCELIKK